MPVAEGAQRDSVAASSRSFASPPAAKLTPAAGLRRGPENGNVPHRRGGAIARLRADVGIGPYARKKGTDVPLRRKRRIRAGRPRKKCHFRTGCA